MRHVVINAGVKVGKNCIINTKPLLAHDVIVEDRCHASTGVLFNGGAHLGGDTFIGSGVVVREGDRLGSDCVVGAAAIVLRDLPANTIHRRDPCPRF